jgi:acyl-homoserine-lactone acylase
VPVYPLLLALSLIQAPSSAPDSAALARMEEHTRAVRITRDDWGIAHVHGTTDADAVFGMIYAQAEDDFDRIERNYLVSLGRLAESDGEDALWQDLRQRLFLDPDSLQALYRTSPPWLRRLMDAWADGLNYYLATHPAVHPRVLTRFEPWMPLSFSEGSIGGDIETVDLDSLRAFYSVGPAPASTGTISGDGRSDEAGIDPPQQSNGIAIAPVNTAAGRALLLINPHTTFFFRSELQMTSDEGLDAYGAATWGQFFIYQGFNRRVGWMHTSTGADAIDEYAETIERKGGGPVYRYGRELRPVRTDTIALRYRQAGELRTRSFTVYHTQHGPVVRASGGKWITVSLMNRPVQALSQSFLRTRARNLTEYRRTMGLNANSSNNTVYADADGHIGYFHPQFVPRREDRFDWTRPVDGSNPATDWHGVHGVEESPHVVDPPKGWIQNTNNWPYSAAGPDSPRREAYPRYMDVVGEIPRGQQALRVLTGQRNWTPERLRAAAFDPYLTAFARLIPRLVAAFDSVAAEPSAQGLADPVSALRGWDYRWSAASVPTTLAVSWGDELMTRVRGRVPINPEMAIYDYMADSTTAAEKLDALRTAVDRIARDFGSWRTPWGEINRFQRPGPDPAHPFDDAKVSVPVPFTASTWGSLAAISSRTYPGTRRRYGRYGNTFVAVVEFGRDSVRALAVTPGGESGDRASPHYNDQAVRYATGALRPVYFYPDQLRGHTERVCRPGE